jgi:hypothetical protein
MTTFLSIILDDRCIGQKIIHSTLFDMLIHKQQDNTKIIVISLFF